MESEIDPTLRDVIQVVNDCGYWAMVMDHQWQFVAQTDEQAVFLPDGLPAGDFIYGPEAREFFYGGSVGNSIDEDREEVSKFGHWMLADLGIDREALRCKLHPELREAVDELEEPLADVQTWVRPTRHLGGKINVRVMAQRVRDSTGRVVGTVMITGPAVGTTTVAMLAGAADLDHLHWMRQFSAVDRRPAAILFADLEGSAQLSKRLSTASYFALVRRMTKAADDCVIDAGGLVGRHAGDGVAAFFPAEVAGSESAAARSCIDAARSLQAAMSKIAERHDLPPEVVTVRTGLHWGATLYIGSIVTRGRTEVTALGDEVNEAARIEACATGGRALASKSLIERLRKDDAAVLGIDTSQISYTQLAELSTATDKARRDAPAVAVYDIGLTAP